MVDRTQTSWIRTLDKETVEAVQGVVKGIIPDWVNGVLLRNGSGVNQAGGVQFNHLFDGLSVLHRFAIENGKATYQNRLLQSEVYKDIALKHRLTVAQFGTVAFPDPCQSLLGRFMAKFSSSKPKFNDNCAVNVAFYGDALYAMTESTNIHRVDPESLETIHDKKVFINNYVAVNHATAHPHVEKDGTIYNMGNTYRGRPAYHIIKFPAGEHQSDDMSTFKHASLVGSIPCRWKVHPAYFHSFGITENYFVFLETPLTLNLLKLATMKLTGYSVKDCMEWFAQETTRIILVERSTGDVVPVTYDAPALFAFHFANCYEKDEQLVVDICAVEDGLKLIDSLSIQPLTDKTAFHCPYPTRLVLPLNVKEAPKDTNLVTLKGTQCKAFKRNESIFCEPEKLSKLSMEVPRINYAFNGQEYRFIYGIGLEDNCSDPCRLVKLDVETKETLVWEKPGFSVSEPIFVARPSSELEDDGVILSAIIEQEDHCKVYLLVLNSADFKELAMVEFQANGIVPQTFHGIFASKSESVHAY